MAARVYRWSLDLQMWPLFLVKRERFACRITSLSWRQEWRLTPFMVVAMIRLLCTSLGIASDMRRVGEGGEQGGSNRPSEHTDEAAICEKTSDHRV